LEKRRAALLPAVLGSWFVVRDSLRDFAAARHSSFAIPAKGRSTGRAQQAEVRMKYTATPLAVRGRAATEGRGVLEAEPVA
jgi:hypothetical protein